MPTKYVRCVELKPQYGIPFCRVHLKRKIAAGEFPEPVYLGPNTIAWREEEILAWRERKRTERDKGRKIALADASDSLNDAPADSCPDRRKAIIAKIRSLMAKTVEKGATEGEARAAAEKAEELIAKYAIELCSLDEREAHRRTRKSGGGDTTAA